MKNFDQILYFAMMSAIFAYIGACRYDDCRLRPNLVSEHTWSEPSDQVLIIGDNNACIHSYDFITPDFVLNSNHEQL